MFERTLHTHFCLFLGIHIRKTSYIVGTEKENIVKTVVPSAGYRKTKSKLKIKAEPRKGLVM